jgi:Leucine-rich repeat (LRR) protein
MMQDPLGLLPVPVLRHRCISEDQQVLCKLQQTSKGLQAAVADEHSGHVHAALSTSKVQQADAFAAWLRKHAGLLQQLELDLGSSWMTGGRRNWVATSLAEALQHAAAAGCLRLQSFSLKGSAAGAAVLGSLAAAQLTHLAVDITNGTDVGDVAALTALRSLELRFGQRSTQPTQPWNPAAPASGGDLGAVLASLLGQLQHLTQLRIGPIFATELAQLLSPSEQSRLPSLQQLDVQLNHGNLPDCAVNLQLMSQLTALRSLILEGSSALPGDAGNVLVSLSALQLTQLQLPSVSRNQVAQLQLPQLQQLQVLLSSKPGQLQLGHMTAMHTLHGIDMGINSRFAHGDQLPPNLQQLSWDWRSREQLVVDNAPRASMQPLLALTRLQQLRLAFNRRLASDGVDDSCSSQLAELVELPRLQELALHYNSVSLPSVEAAAAAWVVLPLVELSLSSDNADRRTRIPADVLQQLGQLQGLTHLALRGSYSNATLVELAAVLQQLRCLQHLALGEPFWALSLQRTISEETHGVAAAAALLQALDELRKLHTVQVSLPLKLAGCETHDEAKQRAEPLEQALGNQLSGCCSVRVRSDEPFDVAELNIRTR